MPELKDIGGGLKIVDGSQGSDLLETAQRQLGLVDLVNRIQSAPLEQKIKQIDAALKGNELLNVDIKNEKARVDLLSAKNDEARKALDFQMTQIKSLPTLFNTDFELGKAYAQQIGLHAAQNEDGTIRIVKPGKNGQLESMTFSPKKINDPEKIAQGERDLRKDWETQGKDFGIQSQFYKNMKSLAQLRSPQGDIGIIFSYMKLLDPVSSVREGEQATARNAPSVPEQVRGMYNRALTSKGAFFSDDARRGFLEAGQAIYNDSLESHYQRGKFYLDMDSKRNPETNYNSKNILVPVGGIGFDQIAERFKEQEPEEVATSDRVPQQRSTQPKEVIKKNKAAEDFDALMNNFYKGLGGR